MRGHRLGDTSHHHHDAALEGGIVHMPRPGNVFLNRADPDHVIQGRVPLQTGISDQDVDRADAPDERYEEGLNVILPGDVGPVGKGPGTLCLDCRDHRLGRIRVGKVIDGHRGLGPAQAYGDRPSDARTDPADMGGLPTLYTVNICLASAIIRSSKEEDKPFTKK
jgi:hypothetical protein